MWIGVAIFMAGFFILWMVTSDINSGNQKIAEQKDAEGVNSFSEIKKEIPSLWQSLKASLGDLFESGIREAKPQTKKPEAGQIYPKKLK